MPWLPLLSVVELDQGSCQILRLFCVPPLCLAPSYCSYVIPSQALLSPSVQLTPPECKAMLDALNSAVDATEDKPGELLCPSVLLCQL
jgi:hypothetical protein